MLLTWFCSAKTARPPQEQSPIDIQQALRQIGNLPSLSETAARAVSLANDPRATMGDYANLIKRDGGLAAAILKLANSSLYRGSSPVTGHEGDQIAMFPLLRHGETSRACPGW